MPVPAEQKDRHAITPVATPIERAIRTGLGPGRAAAGPNWGIRSIRSGARAMMDEELTAHAEKSDGYHDVTPG